MANVLGVLVGTLERGGLDTLVDYGAGKINRWVLGGRDTSPPLDQVAARMGRTVESGAGAVATAEAGPIGVLALKVGGLVSGAAGRLWDATVGKLFHALSTGRAEDRRAPGEAAAAAAKMEIGPKSNFATHLADASTQRSTANPAAGGLWANIQANIQELIQRIQNAFGFGSPTPGVAPAN